MENLKLNSTDLTLTDEQKKKILEAITSDDFYDTINYKIEDFQCSDKDLIDQTIAEDGGLRKYFSFRSGEGYVTNVKTYLGSYNNPLSNLDEHIVNDYISYLNDYRHMMEFDGMSDKYKDIGELICVGRNGGYWGFKEFDFRTYKEDGKIDHETSWEVKFNINKMVKYVLDNFDELNQKYFKISNMSFDEEEMYLDQDGEDLALSWINNIDLIKWMEINSLLIQRIGVFINDCKRLVDYYEDCNNLIMEIKKEEADFCEDLDIENLGGCNFIVNDNNLKLDPNDFKVISADKDIETSVFKNEIVEFIIERFLTRENKNG